MSENQFQLILEFKLREFVFNFVAFIRSNQLKMVLESPGAVAGDGGWVSGANKSRHPVVEWFRPGYIHYLGLCRYRMV